MCLFAFCQNSTVNVFIDVGNGVPINLLCTPDSVDDVEPEDIDGEVDCAGNNGFLFGGPYEFNDPIPTGNLISNIEVVLYNAACESDDIVIDLAGGMIMAMSSDSPCSFGVVDCGNQLNVSSQSFDPNLDFGYNYGGTNMFNVMAMGGADGNLCLTHAELIFTFVESDVPTIPTLGQWGIILLSILLTTFAIATVRKKQVHISHE